MGYQSPGQWSAPGCNPAWGVWWFAHWRKFSGPHIISLLSSACSNILLSPTNCRPLAQRNLRRGIVRENLDKGPLKHQIQGQGLWSKGCVLVLVSSSSELEKSLNFVLKHKILWIASLNNLENEEQSWRYHASWLQTMVQSCRNQSNIELA